MNQSKSPKSIENPKPHPDSVSGAQRGMKDTSKAEIYKGVLFILISGVFFSFMGLFVSLAGDLPVIQKSFFRNFISMLLSLAILLQSRVHWKVGKGNRLTLFLRATCGTLGLVCNFYALSHLQISDAVILNKLAPFCTILFSCVLLKEKIKPWQAILIGVAFVGALFVIKPSFANANLFASLVGVAGGVLAGAAYTFLRKCQQGGVQGAFIVFFFSAFSTLVLLPVLVLQYEPMTLQQSIYLVLTGLCAAGGQFGITAAYRHAPAREISIYDYMQIIFSMVLGFVAFGTLPDHWSLLGYVIILSVAILNFLFNRRRLTATKL